MRQSFVVKLLTVQSHVVFFWFSERLALLYDLYN